MYTAKQIRDQKISFKPMSREQFDKLEAHFRKLNYATPSYWIEDNYYRFYPVDCGKQADSKSSAYLNCGVSLESTKEISFEEFDFEDRKIIGYKCPMDLSDSIGVIKVKKDHLFVKEDAHYIAQGDKFFGLPKEIVETWEPVYEEQLKPGDWVVVLPTDSCYNNCEQGKAQKVIELNPSGSIAVAFSDGTRNSYTNVRRATPEEIELAQVKVVRMGGENGFDLTVKRGRVFHKSEDITLYVQDVYETCGDWLDRRAATLGNKYDFYPKDLIISKTGCETKETKLTEWLALYKLIKQ